MRLVLAARLSQVAKGQTGMDTQDIDARAWAVAHGHQIVGAAADHISGRVSPFSRRELGPWLNDPARIALYDGILISKIDRLTRKRDWDIRQWAEDHGKKILVVSPELEWPPALGDTTTRIIWDDLVNLAAAEWENTSIRYQRMQKALREQAFFVGKCPYPYRIVTVDGTDHKTLELDPVRSAIARGMAKRYLEGESLRQISKWLNSEAIPPPQVSKWSYHTVGKILRNPAIIGRIQVKGRTVLRVEPVISVEDYRKIQTQMSSHQRHPTRKESPLLTGILFDRQGHTLYRITGRKIPSVPNGQYYYCRECPKGSRVLIPLNYADDVMDEEVMSYGDHPHFETVVMPGTGYEDEIGQVRLEISELDPESDSYDTDLAALRAELRRLRELPSKPAKVERKPELNPDGSVRTIGEYWQSLDTPERHGWLVRRGWKMVASPITDRENWPEWPYPWFTFEIKPGDLLEDIASLAGVVEMPARPSPWD